jgi:hypothetical protein
MAYVTAVTDRTAADLVAMNSKAYWNVADWTRVYGNSLLTRYLAEIMLPGSIAFTDLGSPTTATIEVASEFNLFLANIEALRVAVAGESIAGTTTPIKDDYAAGPAVDAPDYLDANLWESTIDAIWQHFDGPDLLACPTLSGNLTVTTGNNQIYIDCLNMSTFDADLQGTANLYII